MRTAVGSGTFVRLVAFWDRLRASPGLKGAFLFSAVAALMLGASTIPNREDAALAEAERFAFDQQMRLLREIDPRPLAADVVLDRKSVV